MDQAMEEWRQVFRELIQAEKVWDRWTLILDENLTPNRLQPGWKQCLQVVRAWFQCPWCSRNWASAKIQVLFHMHWNERRSKGWVKMRVFRQRCQKCSLPPFKFPKFTENNISRILNNLVSKILKEYYEEGEECDEEEEEYYGEGFRDYRHQGTHDCDNCEACLLGFCVRSGLGRSTRSRAPSSLSSRSWPVESSSNEPCPTKGSSAEDSVTGNTPMENAEELPKPEVPEPAQVASPSANTDDQEQTIIQVPTCGEDLCSRIAQNPTRKKIVVCGCVLISILVIVVVVVVVVVKFTN